MAKNTIKHPPPPPPCVKPNEGGEIQFPNKNDVLSGRGGRINNHEGNVHFRKLVAGVKVKYLSKQTKKLDKAWIAADIVDQIRKLNPAGRFLKEDPDSGLWVEVGDERARRKTGQALREDAPDLREELEEQDRSNYAMMAAARHNPYMMPMAPGMYPTPAGYMPYPPGPMYYPQMYPQQLQYPGQYPGMQAPGSMPLAQPPGTMPQTAGPGGAQIPYPAPSMNPYMYPPAMYPSPVPMPAPASALQQPSLQTSQPLNNQQQGAKPGEVNTSTSTGNTGSSNFTGVSDISADTKLLALMGSEEHQKKLALKELIKEESLSSSSDIAPVITPQNKDRKTSFPVSASTQIPVSSLKDSNISQLTTDTQAMLLSNMANSTMTVGTALPIGNLLGNSQSSDSGNIMTTGLPIDNRTAHHSGIITNASSNPSDTTESSFEYQHNIQVPIKDPMPTPQTTATTNANTASRGASSRRNQWREQLKQNVSQFSDMLPPNKKHNIQQTPAEQTSSIIKQSDPKKQQMPEFLPMDEDTRNFRFSNASSSNKASNSSSSSKSSVRYNYLFSSSIMSELSLASQNLGKDTHYSFRKSMSMTDLDVHGSMENQNAVSRGDSIVNGANNNNTAMEDCQASATMDKSMADSSCSWIKGYNPVASDLNPWISESNRSMFSEISMDLLALDLAGEKTSSITQQQQLNVGGNNSDLVHNIVTKQISFGSKASV